MWVCGEGNYCEELINHVYYGYSFFSSNSPINNAYTSIIPTSTGKYYVGFIFKHEKYEIYTIQFKQINITQITDHYEWTNYEDIVYNGESRDYPKATYKNIEVQTSIEQNKDFKNVGEYSFVAPKYYYKGKFTNDANSNIADIVFTDNTTKKVTITKANNKISNLNIKDFYYGESIDLSFDVQFGKGMEVIEYYNTDTKQKLPGIPTDVGSYKMVVTVPGTSNWNELKEEYTFNILKAQNEILINPVLNSFAYDSQETSPLPAEFKFGNDDIIYKYFDENDNELNYIPKEVGKYYLLALVNETKNYFAKQSDKIMFEITKINNSWTLNPSIDSISYGSGKDLNLQFKSKYGLDSAIIEYYEDGVKLSYTPFEVGKYSVRIYIPETRNYYSMEESLSFEITKASNTWTKKAKDQQWVYKESNIDLNSSALFGNDKIQIKYFKDGQELFDVPYFVGNYIVQILIPDNRNYFGIEYQFNVTITKAIYDLSHLNYKDIVVDSLDRIDYKIQESLPDSLDVRYEIYRNGKKVDSINTTGDYQIRAIFTNNDSNYFDVNDMTINVSVKNNLLVSMLIILLSSLMLCLVLVYFLLPRKKKEKFILQNNMLE